MKNIIKLIGIIALVAAIGFSMAACDDDSGPGDGGGGGGGGGGSGFTLTGIPSKYNGKYAAAYPLFDGNIIVFGCKTIRSGGEITLVRISNGSVTIPLWFTDFTAMDFVKYSGNDTARQVEVVICDSENVDDIDDTDYRAVVLFQQVKFSNGNASRAWNNGQVYEIPQ